MEGLILFLAIGLVILALTMFFKKKDKIEEEIQIQKREIEQNNIKTIQENYDLLIRNGDTKTEFDSHKTSYSGEKIIHGGALNYSNWSFENTLKFIAKNSLKLKHLDLQRYTFKNMSDDLDSDKIFSNKLDSIASKAEKNNKDEVKNENDINEAIKKILLIKNTIRDLKSWLIQNLEKILIENARNGKKLPFILIFEDHYSKYLNYWLFPHFNTLGLSHPDIYYMDRKEYYEIIFTFIYSNSKLDKYFKKLNLEYALYGGQDLRGLIIFKQGQKIRYLNNEISIY